MVELTLEGVIEAAKAVVSERPDYVYSNDDIDGWTEGDPCYYVHGEGENMRPGCLVGATLHRLGVPLEVLDEEKLNNFTAHQLMRRLAVGGVVTLENSVYGRASKFLQYLQILQDDGLSWQDSLNETFEELDIAQ